jgi:hypothetical protein
LATAASCRSYRKFNYAEKSRILGPGLGNCGNGYLPEFCSGPITTCFDISPIPGWRSLTAIHYYEAILATLAIVVWHFYAVIFDPDVYPLKWTLINGRAPEHEVREEEEEATPQAAPEPKAGSGSI